MSDVSLKIGLDQGALQTGLKSAQNSIRTFAGGIGGQLAGALSFGAIAAGLKNAIDKGDQLQDLANRFGVAAESLQRVGNAASLSGGSIEEVAGAMNKLARNAGEAISGNKTMEEAFGRIGLSVSDLKSMTPDQIFLALSKSVQQGGGSLQDFANAQELAGRGAAGLMELLRMGPDAIMANGEAMGVWSNDTIRQLSEASDAIKTFQNNITIGFGYAATLANSLVGAFQAVIESLTLLGLAAKEAFTGNLDGAKELVKAAQNVGNERNAREAQAAKAKAVMGPAGDFTDPKEQEKNAKALEELKAGFREVERGKQKRADDEEHRAAMQRAEELGNKIDEQNKKRKEDRDLAVQGLDALIAKKEAGVTPAGAIASSLGKIGGLGEANISMDTADTQLDELRAMRNQLKEIEQRVPDTLDEIKALLQQSGGATLS
jgi:hypothetical protein